MIIVSDTAPISNLILIGELDLLRKLFIEVIVPPAVNKEIVALTGLGYDVSAYKTSPWIKVLLPSNTIEVLNLLSTVDQGEAEAIVLAVELKADYLLIDERLGTKEANSRSLKTVGLLGVIVRAKQQQIIPEVKPLLDRLRQEGFWISQKLINKVLNSVGEV